jgi:hypothetical protein
MKDEVFTPGTTIQYNPLQKKVTVEELVDTRISNDIDPDTGKPFLGSVANQEVLINGVPQSTSSNSIGLPQQRTIVTDYVPAVPAVPAETIDGVNYPAVRPVDAIPGQVR